MDTELCLYHISGRKKKQIPLTEHDQTRKTTHVLCEP